MPRRGQTLRRFFQTPKGLLIVVLAVLTAVASRTAGWRGVAIELLAAVALPAVLDVFLLRARMRRWVFPSGAILTGLIVAMILSPREPWYVGACTVIVAILSKQLFRVQSANVFNPAAAGLVATFFAFHPAQNWWGALPDLSLPALALLVAGGIFIADRVNKMPIVLAFLGSYFLLFTVSAFVGNPGHVAEIFRSPDLHAALYFAFFILTDPPTSPVRYSDQTACGALVAVASFVVFEWVGAVYYLLAGVLVGNLWDARRRSRRRSRAAAA